MKVRSGALATAATGIQRARFVLDIAAGAIEVYDVTIDHFRAAEQLIGRQSYARRLRTLDALQLTVALDLFQQGLADRLVAADQILVEIAAAESLKTMNPEKT